MNGFTIMISLIVIALSIATIATRGTSARQQSTPKRVLRRRAAPTTNPTRLATKPNAVPAKPSICAACHGRQRRLRQIQHEQQMLVALWLFVLHQPTPPAPAIARKDTAQ